MATIKPIEGRTSGQVIVDLCSVVKELVENSLDAGATNIDVRFKNQGLDAIEVQDNGGGISPHNYETLALKHHTSKLSTYNDLTTLQTFGFRGEALSSLCALSSFTVITCMPENAPKGTKLEFEVSGKLKGTSVVAAQKGTTVIVENLFNNLPVRRRELERNIKREWNRVTGVLGQYACIQTGIKFSVSQQAAKGKKTTIFSTKGNPTTRENIVNVFGAKTLTALIPLDLRLELEPTSGPSQKWSTQQDGGTKDVRIIGHISRPATGEGRQTPDRQMFFVNARPCALPQVAKAFNEVYKSYSGWGSTQSPFIFANIELDTHLYDVNVSPDKRTILLHDQSRMLENLKAALTALFEAQDYTVPISQLPAQRQPVYKQLTIGRETPKATRSSQKPSQSPADTAEEGESDNERDRSRQTTTSQSTDNEKSVNDATPKASHSTISRASMTRDSEAVNLISNWVGRNSEERNDQQPTHRKSVQDVHHGLSKEKQKLISKFGKEAANEMGPVADLESPNSSIATIQESGVTVDLDESIQEKPVPREASEHAFGRETSEPPIPALLSPSKISTPGIVGSIGSSRPPRSQPEIATITIGDHTVTSSIGTPYPKRLRLDLPSTPTPRPKHNRGDATIPSFGNRLSQRFAAPGTQATNSDTEPAIFERDSEMPDTQNPDPSMATTQESRSHGSNTSSPLARGESPEEDVGDGDDENPPGQSPKEDVSPRSLNAPSDSEKDDEYVDEAESKAREEARVQEIIEEAERTSAVLSQDNLTRGKSLLRGAAKRKESTYHLVRTMDTTALDIRKQFHSLNTALSAYVDTTTSISQDEALDADGAEERLSLTISKSDFAKMKVIGQFNLGFILASKAPEPGADNSVHTANNVFIIDQHSSDEKYNFERLQATTIVQSQRLVYPKTLSLTALEEEIVAENLEALESNGFIVTMDSSSQNVGARCQLVSLPVSRETTFSINDLEELIALIAEQGGVLLSKGKGVPRPSKVRKMFAMRACRSSIMIGKSLDRRQMEKVVRHMGEIDKPWNCPHGRPTMRHLCGLGTWDEVGWREGRGEGRTDWARWVRGRKEVVEG
ncbi:dna mismatch repair protein [Rutstroemia sp. NJR-2017a BVV2]|nr:dna mismatch repair protein [Rutstroemia sp. NJR-2017a BVV2]